ncbi:glycoside hydrolase family protein [Niallia circulans]|uniref:glycoside hydrolase family 3 protein n=1 Tax=Shouchella clausii TaxID=79880 RepID=UPI000BA787B1|nr:glycoside hydrolase family 3 N-terminal domain-containing protein [Shouchella clausii]PAF14913.1 beta-glucosidase [Shouchella clausii]SPU21014.1 glycoside hydrolase family protein [Niallia circulans]
MAYKKIKKNGHTVYVNEGGKVIGTKHIPVIERNGYIFKDFERTGELLPYEDWRLDPKTRAEDLVDRLTVEEKIGLMLHSSHQAIPTLPRTTVYPHTYNGKPFLESDEKPWALTDQQQQLLKDEHVRHLLAANFKDTETMVKWNNHLQELAETLPHGIPVTISTDPRHGVGDGDQEYKGSVGDISKWPEGIGLAATFSPETCKEFAEVASKEYRALGMSTALGPQIDLATDPRWMRGMDSLGAHTQLTTDLAKAYCDGMQTTTDSADGWGEDSVITMAKHWPGGGTGEGGRDAHYPFGKYAVYPGENFAEHLIPFIEGAMKLDGHTEKCASIMPYYSISWDQDTYDENVGNAYSQYIIKDLLREEYAYDGVVCTDWSIIQDRTPTVGSYVPGGKCHGVEHLSIPERFLKLIMNGVDQFGGVDKGEHVLEAYQLGCEKYGKNIMDEKLRQSAIRILINMFRVGLFENPFVDLELSLDIIGNRKHVEAGYAAQLASVVMLKNQNDVLPLKTKMKVYVPKRHINEFYTFIRFKSTVQEIDPVSKDLLAEYFEPVQNIHEADAAIVFVDSPIGNNGFDPEDLENGGTGYEPISLQYPPYTAKQGRKVSIAGGDPREKTLNRSYYGKTATAANESDLDNVILMKEKMGDKPVIVCIRMKNPAVLSELERYADAILVDFGVQKKALLDVISGNHEPKGLLPVHLPKDMETVENHCEDVAFDIEPYTDTNGNTYAFGFGLNYSGGVIKDDRTRRYHI